MAVVRFSKKAGIVNRAFGGFPAVRQPNAPFTITLSLRWWVLPYINTLKFYAWCFDLDVDVDKMTRKIQDYGIKIHFRPA